MPRPKPAKAGFPILQPPVSTGGRHPADDVRRIVRLDQRTNAAAEPGGPKRTYQHRRSRSGGADPADTTRPASPYDAGTRMTARSPPTTADPAFPDPYDQDPLKPFRA